MGGGCRSLPVGGGEKEGAAEGSTEAVEASNIYKWLALTVKEKKMEHIYVV